MIVIELVPASIPRQPGEGLDVDVHVRNNGAETEVMNPAALRATPLWRLRELRSGMDHVTGNEQGYAPPPGQPERLRLAPGESWNGRVLIKSVNVSLTPGPWAVSLMLAVDGGVEESPPCIVHVADWAIGAADVGWGMSGDSSPSGDALMVQRTGTAKPALYHMNWRDDDSDRSGTGAETPIRLGTLGPNATDPLVPVRDGPFWSDASQWFLWREGASIHARGMGGEQQELTLPEAPTALLRPALQRMNDDILVFALSANRRQLVRLLFSHDNSKPPARAEEIDLPVVAAHGSAVFSPSGSVLVGLSAEKTDGGCELLVIDQGGLAPPRLASWTNVSLVPGAPPALSFDDDGGSRIAALVSSDDGIALAEARFSPALNAVPTVSLLPLGGRGTVPIGGAVLYAAPHAHAHTHEHRANFHAVICLADHSFMRLGVDGTLEAVTYEASPVPPFCLVHAGHGALLLCCDPLLGPYLTDA